MKPLMDAANNYKLRDLSSLARTRLIIQNYAISFNPNKPSNSALLKPLPINLTADFTSLSTTAFMSSRFLSCNCRIRISIVSEM